jgi:hypothetical protein
MVVLSTLPHNDVTEIKLNVGWVDPAEKRGKPNTGFRWVTAQKAAPNPPYVVIGMVI